MNKPKDKINIASVTSKDLEEELKREAYRYKYLKVLKSTIYILVIIFAISSLLATFFMPVLQISGSSMSPQFNNGEFVISIKTNKLDRQDVIAFYRGNKILIKRIIATPGEWVVIDEEGTIFIDGIELKEPYISNKVVGEYNIKFPYQVPDNSYFILSDDRTESLDSRNSEIGCIPKEDIIGKIIFKIWPLKNFGLIK